MAVFATLFALSLGLGLAPANAKNGPKEGKCPASSHNPGGTPPNCGKAPPAGATTCAPAGPITGPLNTQVNDAVVRPQSAALADGICQVLNALATAGV